MIESMLIILIIIAILMLVLSWHWESITLSVIDTILWLVISLGVYNFEVPYQYTSGGSIVEATQTIESMYPIGWLFILLTLVMMIHTMILIFELLQGRPKQMM